MGSKNPNKGANQANRMAKQAEAAQKNYGKPAHLSAPVGGFTRSQLAGNITGGGGNVTFGGGQNVTRDYSRTALGQAGVHPSMVGGYGISPGDEKFSPAEIRNIGVERDRIVNDYGKPAHLTAPVGGPMGSAQLEKLSQYNRALGINPTAGMGFGESLRQNLGGLEAKRDFAQLGNLAKGIANVLPGRALVTGLLNKIPGVNLPTQLSMSPINYNITDQMRASGLSNLLSPQQQEMYSPSLMNRYLFGDLAQRTTQPVTQFNRQPVFTGEQTTMTPMRRPEQPAITDNRFMPYDMLQLGPLYGAGPFGPYDFVNEGFYENFNDVGQMDRYAEFHNEGLDGLNFQKFLDPIHHPPVGGPLVPFDTRIDQFIAGAPNVGVYPNNLGMSQEAMDAWNMTPQIAADNQAKAMGVYGYGN